MKIVTYNVNGLRARIVPYKSLHGFLNALDADILCFQETKLSRQELTADIAMAEGYEAFFSCTRTSNKGRIGYSGVATFCRTPVTTSCTSGILPIAADEGFTGLLHCSKGGEIEGGDSRVGCYGDVLNMTMSRDELLCLDSEGRCVVTDHGSFVLFNIYGPCVQCGDTKRMEFKLNFYQALQCRWESLLEAGKRLIIVGDLNIAPFPNDSCDPGPKFNSNPCRRWLQSLLSTQNGPFTDTFRAIHSVRKDAYTCWSQASGAEEFNWGTRIDLILAAGSCTHPGNNVLGPGTSRGCHGFAKCEVEDCDIMVKFKRLKEDSIPRWAGGRNLKLEGSDHAPVFVTLKEQPPVRSHEIPSLAVRFLPQLRGRQQSIDSLLQKRNLTSNGPDVELSCATMMHVGSKEGVLYKEEDEVAPHVDKVVTICGKAERIDVETSSANGSENVSLSHRSCCRKFTPALKVQMSQKLKRKEVQKASQMSLRTFFARSSCSSPVSANLNADCGTPLPASQEFSTQEPKTREITSANMSSSSHMQEVTRVHHGDIKGAVAYSAAGMQERPAHVDKEEGFTTSIEYGSHGNVHKWEDNKLIKSYCFGESGKTRSDVKQKSAQTEWKRIQDLMARRIPVCSGHGEPCVARIVKKGGPNLGRGFYVCARAQGPTSNPEARCDHFEWASEKSKR